MHRGILESRCPRTVATKLEGKEMWYKAGVCYEMQRLLGTEERGAPLPGSHTTYPGIISAVPGRTTSLGSLPALHRPVK